ncbi:hypothetical protein NDU88_004992 [Pleurodeles waltl]|uniref:Uncharacterized protein n=1 Tax=Pleurodeles waltl TaxID=8319 RepID=A0AAV7WAT0_PLEWA|nr:hypothetical protein NDU88_004992 [Pleurodeles waltl]
MAALRFRSRKEARSRGVHQRGSRSPLLATKGLECCLFAASLYSEFDSADEKFYRCLSCLERGDQFPIKKGR